MNKALLITRPRYDAITNYFYTWSEKILRIAKNKRIPIYDLKESKANKSRFESYIKAHQPSFIFLNGHGNSEMIAGHNNELLVDKTSLITEGIIYARSCNAADNLGHMLTKKNLKTFIGYTRKFILGYRVDLVSTPAKDNIAKLFLEPSNSVAIVLLKGHTAQEAHNRSRNSMYQNFRKMISSTASFEERFAARWLWSNYKSQVLIGNKLQTI